MSWTELIFTHKIYVLWSQEIKLNTPKLENQINFHSLHGKSVWKRLMDWWKRNEKIYSFQLAFKSSESERSWFLSEKFLNIVEEI